MPSYKFTLHSGQMYMADDKRTLEKLSEDLCTAGFLVVERINVGYSKDAKPISLLERAISMIEPADRSS